MKLDALPNDVLYLICAQFCFHCQHRGHLPDVDAQEVRDDKGILAKLCRVSKSLCEAAQPILHHHFASLDLETDERWFPGLIWFHDLAKRIDDKPDPFPQFLRTVIERPDLALRVQSLQVLYIRRLDVIEYFCKDQIAVIESVIRLGTANNLPPWSSGDPDYGDLAIIALQCLPQLSSLLLFRHDFDDFTLKLDQVQDLKLPALRTVSFADGEHNDHFTDLHTLYNAAPNLETVYANGGFPMLPDPSNFDPKYNGLTNLRKLCIEGFSPQHMEELVSKGSGKLARLEDLEYYWGREHINLDAILCCFRTTLRRLCLVHVPPRRWGGVYMRYYQCPWSDYAAIDTLNTMERLEDISLDCRSIYREDTPDTLHRLTNFLPRTVRRFRIFYLYRGIANGLSGLAKSAPHQFPDLKRVTVGVAEMAQFTDGMTSEDDRPDDEHGLDIRLTKEAGKLFDAVNIRFAWKEDCQRSHPRSMIPGANRSDCVNLPRVADELEEGGAMVQARSSTRSWIGYRSLAVSGLEWAVDRSGSFLSRYSNRLCLDYAIPSPCSMQKYS